MTIFSPFVHDKPFIGFTNGFAGGGSVRRVKPFTPAMLFAAGEQGVWYDPSDLSTMFQDTAGTTPVTAAGQAVGLLLDKSRGLALGPELVTNGTFDTDTAWVKATSVTIANGVANFDNAAGGNDISQSLSLLPGFYKVSFEVKNWVAGGLRLRLRVSGGSIAAEMQTPNQSGNRVVSAVLLVNFTTNLIEILSPGGAGSPSTLHLDNISIRELLGNHATQATTAARPILRQTAGGLWYLEFDGVDDRLLTANVPFSGGQVTSFASIRQTGGTLWVHVWRSSDAGNGYWAVGQQGSTSPPNQFTGVGSPVYRLNAQALNPFTRAEIYNRAFNADTITTTTGLVLAPDRLLISGYTGAFLNGRLYSLIVRGAATPLADIQQTEAWIAAKSGVVLP